MSREIVQSSVPRLSCSSNFDDFSAHPCRPSSSSQANAGPLIDHVAQGGVGVAHKHTQQPARCEARHAGCLTAVMMRILKRICARVLTDYLACLDAYRFVFWGGFNEVTQLQPQSSMCGELMSDNLMLWWWQQSERNVLEILEELEMKNNHKLKNGNKKKNINRIHWGKL